MGQGGEEEIDQLILPAIMIRAASCIAALFRGLELEMGQGSEFCVRERRGDGRSRACSLHYICRGRKGIISVASRGDFRGVVVSIPFYVGGAVVAVVVGRPSPLFSSPLKLPLFCHDFERTVSFLLSLCSLDR